MQNAPERMNDSGTRSPTRAESVQVCSLPVLIKALAHARPDHKAPHLVTTLIEQCKRFDANPAEMRPRILRTIEAIEKAA
jgi:hypothetical protein